MERGDRPWGYYLVLHEDAGYKVKQFVVTPGSRLSLQRHRHRAEHWQVVRGEAVVTRGTETVRLLPGGSIDIPLGALHRVECVGKENLVVIEVQMGKYVGEDDIERIEDDYGRDVTESAPTAPKMK
ncbi:MAG: phosphomannose isomerase type II C-terminal cupin domain [Deltaproteobacteria bacterium]|nr:phosphomannose isomerase type II C-terminal cupin domain [Candidatus Deferrimicrobium borealis]